MKRLCVAIVMAVCFAPSCGRADVAVAELFTSQGCSSCPPADKVLADLAQDPSVIALACHVNYWDQGGWKDTLSSQACTARQQAYGQVLGSDLYTPQMVVGGQKQMIGSQSLDVKDAVASTRAAPVAVRLQADSIQAELPTIDLGGHQASLLLFAFDDHMSQAIGGGENSGRMITYTHPVRASMTVGAWDGQAKTVKIPRGGTTPTGGYAVLAQLADNGKIVAAGQVLTNGGGQP